MPVKIVSGKAELWCINRTGSVDAHGHVMVGAGGAIWKSCAENGAPDGKDIRVRVFVCAACGYLEQYAEKILLKVIGK